MSEGKPSKVVMFDGDDPAMARAGERARATFGYFWREVAWERRRIVPGLDLACVKAPFSDGEAARSSKAPRVEEMWIAEVDFDGRIVSGELLNSPNWLQSVGQGDSVRLPLAKISDWMYAIGGEVFGAYTVNLLRSRMSRAELSEHDKAWGLNFGDPKTIRLAPASGGGGGKLKGLLGKGEAGPPRDHPMSVNMAPSLKEQIAADPSFMTELDDRGWTLLHHQALAGSIATVEVLLEAGADANAVTTNGMTPADLARSLGWDEVVALLEGR